MSHAVLFIKLGVLRSNLFEHFTVSLFSRWIPQLRLQCLVQSLSSQVTVRYMTPLPLSKYYLFCHGQDTLSVTREIIGAEDRWRLAVLYRYSDGPALGKQKHLENVTLMLWWGGCR